MNDHHKTQKGMTIVELVLTVSIFSILVGIISINLLTTRTKATLHTTLTTITTHVKQQQKKAMFLHTEKGDTVDSYGIYFKPGEYILFQGSSYSPNDPSNFIVDLDDNLSFSTINLPNNTIVFATRSGEIMNFNGVQHSIVLTDQTSQEQKTIDMNKLGVITNIQ